jgi:hypothetical protein
MRNGLLGCVVILTGVGVAVGQPPGALPAAPFVMAPSPGAGYAPPQAAMPYALPAQPALPFVMPAPPGLFPPTMMPPVSADGGADGDDSGSDERPHLCDHFWANAEMLLWWIKSTHTPTLLTTGSPADAFPGAFGQPGTSPLFGGDLAYNLRPGGHFDLGFWLSEENGYHFGVQGEYFFLGQGRINFSGSSTGSPVLAQPFLDANTNVESSSLLAFPGLQSGQFTAALSSRLWGAEVETRTEAVDTGVIHIDGLTGLRYLEFLENLDLGETTTLTGPGGALTGLAINQTDSFRTANYFYGAEIGADGRAEFGPVSLRLLAKVAFGDTHETASVGGTTAVATGAGAATTSRSGFLALPTNSGRFGRDIFTVVPEAGFTVGYALTKHIHATAGYSFLYATDVLRPGDQIDHSLNITQIPPPIGPGMLTGPAHPAFPFHETDFWAQGVNVGLEFQY